MWRFLFFALACYFIYKLFMNDRKKKEELKQQEDIHLAQEGVLVQDPVCGIYVSKDSEIRVRNGKDVHCFCSYECRDKYIKELEK